MTIENEKKCKATSVLKSEYYSCCTSSLRSCKLCSVWALSATITLLSDISSAPMAAARCSVEPAPEETKQACKAEFATQKHVCYSFLVLGRDCHQGRTWVISTCRSAIFGKLRSSTTASSGLMSRPGCLVRSSFP